MYINFVISGGEYKEEETITNQKIKEFIDNKEKKYIEISVLYYTLLLTKLGDNISMIFRHNPTGQIINQGHFNSSNTTKVDLTLELHNEYLENVKKIEKEKVIDFINTKINEINKECVRENSYLYSAKPIQKEKNSAVQKTKIDLLIDIKNYIESL